MFRSSLIVAGLLAAGLAYHGQSVSAAGETLQIVASQVTGTAPFDADNTAGNDSTGANDIVRTNDTILYTVGLSNNGGASQAPTISFTLPQGEELVALPSFCRPGSSVTPATLPAPTIPTTAVSWLTLPTQAVVCVLADRVDAVSFNYDFLAKVRSEVPNGTVLDQVVFSATATDSANSPSTDPLQATVSAQARYDLQKNGAGSGDGNSGVVSQTIAACTSPLHASYTACQTVMFPILISARGAGGKGTTPLAPSFSFTDDISPTAFWGATVAADLDLISDPGLAPTVRACGSVSSLATLASFHPYGSGGSPTQQNAVRDSGTIGCTAGATGLTTITVTNADTTAYSYPSLNGTLNVGMPADRAFVISGWYQIEFPLAAIDLLGTESAPGSGAFQLGYTNVYGGFTPLDIAGNLNVAEPTANNDRSGNSIVETGSGFRKQFVGEPGNPANVGGSGYAAGNWSGPPGSTGSGNGTGQVVSDQVAISGLAHTVTSPPGFQSVTHLACDSWDSTKLYLAEDFYRGQAAGTVVDPDTGVVSPAAPFSNTGFMQYFASDGKAVWMSYYPAGMTLTVEYSNGGGTAASANDCLDETTGWYSTPGAVPGNDPVLAADGVYTAVSRVRYALTLPSTISENSSASVFVSIGYRVAPGLAQDTIIPNYAAEREQFSPNGLTIAQMVADDGFVNRLSNYSPGSSSVGPTGSLGDRLQVAVAAARIIKEVWNPATSAFTSSAVPVYDSGVSVDYRLSPTVSSGLPSGSTTDVFVEDCLPLHQSFVTSSFQGIAGERLPDVIADGSPVGSELTCAAGRVYLRWNLGEVVIGSAIPPILYTVDVAETAPNGLLTNTTLVTAAGDNSTVAARTATAQIQISTPTGIKLAKTALIPFVEINPTGVATARTLRWNVTFANVDTINVSNVEVIDVLPSKGLNGTDFTGSLSFTSATVVAGTGISIQYTSAASASINSEPNQASNLAAGATTWCDAPSGGVVVTGTGTCPTSATAVTGLRFVRPGAFAANTPFSVNITMTPLSNDGDDVYVNRVQGRAAGVTLGVGPIDRSITIIESSIGDLVWFDLDADGIQDEGEPPVEGFPVSLTGADLDGNAVSLSTTTDGSGAYEFAGLASGNYTVTFEPTGLTTGQAFTTALAGSDPTADSDGNATTGVVAAFDLSPATADITIDQGIIPGVGGLVLRKVVDDADPSDDLGDATSYPVTVVCDSPDPLPDTSDDVSLPANGTSVSITDLYLGAQCTITETDTDGAAVSYTPSQTVTVNGPALTVTLTNTFPNNLPTTTSGQIPPGNPTTTTTPRFGPLPSTGSSTLTPLLYASVMTIVGFVLWSTRRRRVA